MFGGIREICRALYNTQVETASTERRSFDNKPSVLPINGGNLIFFFLSSKPRCFLLAAVVVARVGCGSSSVFCDSIFVCWPQS